MVGAVRRVEKGEVVGEEEAAEVVFFVVDVGFGVCARRSLRF